MWIGSCDLLFDSLIDHDIDVLRTDCDRIFLVLTGHVAGAAGDRVAVFVQADRDIDFASEGYTGHHDILLAQGEIDGKSRMVDFFYRKRWPAAAGRGSGDDKQGCVPVDACFEFRIDGDFAGDPAGGRRWSARAFLRNGRTIVRNAARRNFREYFYDLVTFCTGRNEI